MRHDGVERVFDDRRRRLQHGYRAITIDNEAGHTIALTMNDAHPVFAAQPPGPALDRGIETAEAAVAFNR